MTKVLIRTRKTHVRPIWRCGRRFDRAGQEVAQEEFTRDEWGRLRRDPALEGVDPETGETVFLGGETEVAADDAAGPDEELKARVADAIRDLKPGDRLSIKSPGWFPAAGPAGDPACPIARRA